MTVFSFDGYDFDSSLCLTKRVVLSLIARLFDPLGFVTPIVIALKCNFQELWRLGLDWDEEIPHVIAEQVRQWLEGVSYLKGWKIPRCYFKKPWNLDGLELHVFSDASEKAYGACLYLICRTSSGLVSSLVMSKAKVAPLKRVTLPRLELLGAVLASRLVLSVRTALYLPDTIECRCWTDSMVVLGWIRGDPARWKQFVRNRVDQIQENTNPAQWKHCAGDSNPADLVTRGISAVELVRSKLWLEGPRDLFVHSEDVSSSDFIDSVEDLECSEVCLSTSTSMQSVFEVERWGSLQKCLRVVAWVLRFQHNSKSVLEDRRTGELSFQELELAKIALFRSVQAQVYAPEIQCLSQKVLLSRKSPLFGLSPFLDKDGVLRVQGRLQECSELSYDEKHPIIIPKGHFAELIVRFQHELLKHAGVNQLLSSLRSTYWIVGLRRMAKRVKGRCVACQKVDKSAFVQPIAPLPGQRVQSTAPFSVIGIDHAGPLYCSDLPGRKFYILLITCAVVRALHLELVGSLGVDDCVCALRKFFARRGLPKTIYSDNAKTFYAAKIQLQRKYASLCPEWKFIAPRAPWWGGWWERLVRSVKSSIKKSVGLKSC
jgi:hypothetical protein